MARVFHYCPAITRRDAIGFSLTFLHRALLKRQMQSFLVCDRDMLSVAPPFTINAEAFAKLDLTADDLLLFHYSFADRNADMLLALPCRKVLIYHNITPGHFFRDVGQNGLADACDAGRYYLKVMVRAFDLVIADSPYNGSELTSEGFSDVKIIPVFYNNPYFADRSGSHEAFLVNRLADEIRLVFIGRFVPNKRLDNVIRVAAILNSKFRQSVRLRFHGKIWDRGHFHYLRHLAEDLGVEANVSYEVDQPQAALRASLASADAFVSASEHEGFMVPLLEAFSAGCPVVALASSAVTQTCGDAGALVKEPNLELMAATVLAIRQDRELRMNMLRKQSQRAEMFSQPRTLNKWIAQLNNLLPVQADA